MAVGKKAGRSGSSGRVKAGDCPLPQSVDERPERDSKGDGSKSGGGGGRRVLDLSANAVDLLPESVDEMTEAQREEAARSLGPVERASRRGGGGGDRGGRDRNASIDPRGDAKKEAGRKGSHHFDPEGAIPLWMERQTRGAAAADQPRQQQQQMSGAAAPPPPMPASGVSNINVHNQTDLQLQLVAVNQQTGQRVQKDLFPKQTLLFAAPLGCELAIRDVKSRIVVLKHRCSEPQTTLVVSDSSVAKIVGGSGHWYDNRVYLAAAGAGGVLLLLLLVALGAYAVHRVAKKYAASGGGGAPPNILL